FDELHYQEGLFSFQVNVVKGANIWMVQRGDGASFAAESLQGDVVARHVFGQEFYGDHSTKTRILGLIHYAHSAFAERGQNSVVGDRLADHGVAWGERR